MSSDDSAAPRDLQANIQDLRKTILERQAQTAAGLSSSMSSSLSIGAPGSALGSSTSTVRGSSSMTTAPTKSTVFIHTTPRKASIAQLTIQSKSLPAYLVYVTENGAEQRFVLTKPVCTIGRREDRDIISKEHASVEKTAQGHFILRDNNSFNGSLVNGKTVVGERRLMDRDRIQLGTIDLTFVDEVGVTASDWRQKAQQHPAFASQLASGDGSMDPPRRHLATNAASDGRGIATPPMVDITTAANSTGHLDPQQSERRKSTRASQHRRPLSMRPAVQNDRNLGLVTILPSERKYEETITVRAELSGQPADDDFRPAVDVHDVNVLRDDYEKLRLAYELSKVGLTEINVLLEKMLELMFSVLPVDRGVVLLQDRKSGLLTIEKVKLREGKDMERREILLSSTILRRVFDTKSCVITMDAFEDPNLGMSESIARGMIRSVLCVPLIAHDEVHGVLHLDSQDRLNAFAEKDLALVRAISNQTAIAIENCKLLQDIEKEVTIREALGRFLPPHVVERCIERGEEPLRKGGRQTDGTILFADIRGFTAMSERSSPQEVVELLNDFFERLVTIVFKYDGVLDKYIGDCLMAAFGTLPDNRADAEYNAVCAALDFKVAIDEMNAERGRTGKAPISIGVGLNTGPLVSGYIGSSQRLEYTCIGDSVNTASRVCSMAQDNQVLITESTYERVSDRIHAQFHASQQFKGKSVEVAVYEALTRQ